MHAKGFDLKDNWLAVTLSNAMGNCFVCGQVNLLSSLRL